MKQEIIDHVANLGFDVYMRDPKDTWLIFVEGDKLGMLDMPRGRGFGLTTVHKPNQTTGTGFRIADDLSDLDAATLRTALVFAPGWASSRDMASVVKYKGIDDYRKRDSWNAGYQLAAKGKERV